MDFCRPRTTKTALLGTAARSRRRARTMPTFCRRTFAVGILIAVVVPLLALGSGSAGAQSVPSTQAPSVTVPSVSTPAGGTPPVSRPPVTTPSVTTPSVTTPPVRTPPVTAPSVNPSPAGIHSGTPSVSIPSVRTPNVGSAPSVSAAGGGVGSQPSSSTPSASVAGTQAGGAGSSSSGATPIAVASDRQAARRRVAQRAAERRQQRELRNLVERSGQCLSTLAPQARQVLLLRAGIGSRHAYTGSEVARLLHITTGREARVEHAAIAELRASASAGRCGISSLATLRVPTQDLLVAGSPPFVGPSQAQPATLGNAGQPASLGNSGQAAPGAKPLGRGTGSQDQRGVSGPRPSPIGSLAIGSLRKSSTPASLLALCVAALLGVLALLAAAGRRLARREQLAVAPASSGPPASGAPSAATTLAPEAAAAEPMAANPAPAAAMAANPAPAAAMAAHHAPAAAGAALAGAAAATAGAAAATASPAGRGTAVAEPSHAPGNGRAISGASGSQATTTSGNNALRPGVPVGGGTAGAAVAELTSTPARGSSHAPGNGRAISGASGSQATTTSGRDALGPGAPVGGGAAATSAPVAASGRARSFSPNQEWRHTHRSQIALILGAAAGGALRAVVFRGLSRH
jgi:hypothetical protein